VLSLIAGSFRYAPMPEHSVRLPAPSRNVFLLRPGSLRRPASANPDHHVELRAAPNSNQLWTDKLYPAIFPA